MLMQGHQKKNSTTNATSILQQSLKDFHDMVKLSQYKSAKPSTATSSKPSQALQNEEASFLKKLSRHSELQQQQQL